MFHCFIYFFVVVRMWPNVGSSVIFVMGELVEWSWDFFIRMPEGS